MSRAWSVTFLGTSSGGGPSKSRNCSSLVVSLGFRSGDLWMVDCGEGTQRQFHWQPYGSTRVSLNNVKKLFVTHMHADHTMGIVPMLRQMLWPPPIGEGPFKVEEKPIGIEIYGPAGIRTFVRSIMSMTLSRCCDRFVVHELLTPEDSVTPCATGDLHFNEVPGRDILCSEDGFWREFLREPGPSGDVVVDAGSIMHRDPCLGFIFREASGPQRKIVALGDTSDPSAIIPLCVEPPPSLLIHEATDAHIPRHIDYKAKRSPEVILEKTLARGHSLPTMAGAFARKIGAQRLVMNHISSRFPAPFENDRDATKRNVITEIERQASEAWGIGQAEAAYDFMTVVIPSPRRDFEGGGSGTTPFVHTDNTSGDAGGAQQQQVSLSSTSRPNQNNYYRHGSQDRQGAWRQFAGGSHGYDARSGREDSQSGPSSRGGFGHHRRQNGSRGGYDNRNKKRYRSDDSRR